MLAVVFWHRRKTQCARKRYREGLIDFHEGLKAVKPKQFRFSATFETTAVPWLDSDTEIFEDWYVLSKFAGMDFMDHAVLQARSCREPHKWLMRKVRDAKGGFYGLAGGQPRVSRLLHANWFTMTRHYSTERLVQMIGLGATTADYSLWTRAMAAGPAPNCLLSSRPVELPAALSPFSQTRKLLWSGA